MTAVRLQTARPDGARAARPADDAARHGARRRPSCRSARGTVKGMHWRDGVAETGAEIVLGNTYHLMLRPGAERIAALGGCTGFTGWTGRS
jgi:queuine tRNA-ribosyltransferase